MSQEQKPEAHEAHASSPDELVQDLEPQLSDNEAEGVKGGAEFKQLQDMTNNQQTTAQKAAEKADQYIRS